MAGTGLEAPPVPAPPATSTPVMGLGKGITASLVVALFVALGEVNRLSGQVLDEQARSWSFTALMGPGALGAVDGWSATFPAYAGERATWLLLYVALDVVLIAIYGMVVANWLAEHGAGVLAWILRVLAIVDVVEDGLALFTVHHPSVAMRVRHRGHLDRRSGSSVLAAVVVAAYLALQHGPVIRSWLRGIYTQRFSVIAILPIAVLTVPAGSDLLDQLPDVERRWFESSWFGDGHFWAAVVAVLLTAVGLLVVGRLRSGVFWQRTEESVGDGGEGQPVARRHRAARPRHRAGRRRRGVPPVAVGPARLRPPSAGVLPAGPGRDRGWPRCSSGAGATRAGPGRPRCSARGTTRCGRPRTRCASRWSATSSWRSPSS